MIKIYIWKEGYSFVRLSNQDIIISYPEEDGGGTPIVSSDNNGAVNNE